MRRHVAEQLYLALLALEPADTGAPEGGVCEEAAAAAQEEVVGTAWDQDVGTSKAARDRLAELLQAGLFPC